MDLGDGIKFDRALSHIPDQMNRIFQKSDPIKMQICVNIRHLSSIDAATNRGHGSQQRPAVENGGIDRAIVDRKEVRITDLDLHPHGNVNRANGRRCDPESVEAEADDADLRVGGPEEEDGGGEEEEGENDGDEGGGGGEDLETAAALAAAALEGVDGEEEVSRRAVFVGGMGRKAVSRSLCPWRRLR